ncbi:hypothetical protein Clacol_009260 [Clathrus columnatus]|uniref:Uncharacterized protein n=1 Tax=Clathrus columnatus TaxID=1419009 RepID=A0AAV5AQA2_9AGAM|nr:hypothetical protein Clacol_009260 [Clathrus columnatus]
MSLPAGKSVTVQLAGNVAFTKLGQNPGAEWPGGALPGTKNESIVSDTYWNDGDAGNLHTNSKADVAGCALAIAYTDDAKVVRPEDFTVFSVQQVCVWHRDTVFEVPAAMPPCPNGKCEPNQCIKGPKMAMYWKNTECNNMPNPGHFAPTYGNNYGFFQGAQDDIFETINESNWTCPQSKAAGVFASQNLVQVPAQTSSNNQSAPKSPPVSSFKSPVSPSSTSLTKLSTPVALPPTQIPSQTHQVPTNSPEPSSAPPSQSTRSSIRSSSTFKPEASSLSGSKPKPSQSKSESASLPQHTHSSTCRHSPRKRRSFSHSLPNSHKRSSTSTY